jgi:hypothetical protein
MDSVWSQPFFYFFLPAFFTLAVYSFLFKDNPWFKFAEHVFAGLSAGYYAGLIFNSVIKQQMFVPMVSSGRWDLIIPGLLGCLLFVRFFPRTRWLTRLPLAFVIGTTAGIMFLQQLHGLILPQMKSTLLPLNNFGNIVIVVGVLTTLIYFYFSKPHTGALGGVAKVGIWFIMVAFGAHFGYTVMARVSLLIGRMQFLFVDWLHWVQ